MWSAAQCVRATQQLSASRLFAVIVFGSCNQWVHKNQVNAAACPAPLEMRGGSFVQAEVLVNPQDCECMHMIMCSCVRLSVCLYLCVLGCLSIADSPLTLDHQSTRKLATLFCRSEMA